MTESLLIQAVRNRNSPLARQLLGAGTLPNQISKGGESPLTIAAQTGATGIAKDLLAAGAERDFIGTHWQMSPLQLAVAFGHRGIVALLLPLAEIDLIEPQFGQTALFYVVSKLAMRRHDHSLDILRLLLTAEPDCQIRNFAGQSVLDLAIAAELTHHTQLLSESC